MEPRLVATLVIQSPCYFWPGKFSNEKTLLTQSPVDVANSYILKSQIVASFTIKYFTPLKRLLVRSFEN